MFLSETENYSVVIAMAMITTHLAQSETLCTWRRLLTGTWEISEPPRLMGRLVKMKVVMPT